MAVDFKVSWSDKDRGFKELKKRLGRQLNGLSISAGVQDRQAGERTKDGGTPLGEVAGINEFGSPGGFIPPRPFIGAAFDKHRAWRAEIAAAGRAVVDGMTPTSAMLRAARKIREDLVKVIDTAHFVPNAPSTIARKGSDKPLLEHGDLREAITAKVYHGKVEQSR